MMEQKSFVFGVPVEDYNFAGREAELRRLKADFTGGINVILMSPRRMGKTSLVKKACRELEAESIRFVYMDIFGCKNEYEFYNKFAASILQQTATRRERWWEDAKDFMLRLTPKLSFSVDPQQEVSVSLGITPKTHSPEEILQLPETLAQRLGKRIVVCIDEFQQIGEMPDSAQIQARMRSLWQHQQHASYCLFGSKHHLMGSMFLSKSMPFYQFGDLMALQPIDDASWQSYITARFRDLGVAISPEVALSICHMVGSYSAYVQQLAWLVSLRKKQGDQVESKDVTEAFSELLTIYDILYMQQIEPLSAYQMNFLRAVASGMHDGFTAASVRSEFQLGSYSNVARLKEALLERDLLEQRDREFYFTDPVFAQWFEKRMM